MCVAFYSHWLLRQDSLRPRYIHVQKGIEKKWYLISVSDICEFSSCVLLDRPSVRHNVAIILSRNGSLLTGMGAGVGKRRGQREKQSGEMVSVPNYLAIIWYWDIFAKDVLAVSVFAIGENSRVSTCTLSEESGIEHPYKWMKKRLKTCQKSWKTVALNFP